jgi:UV DNA damage repair endonuclease
VLTNSLIKFTEEEEFNILMVVLDELCPLVTDPKDDIAKAGKLYLKNQNKYIFILFSTIVASLYRKEHVDQLASVKEIFTHYKTQLNVILKTNWQCTLPVLHFLSEYDIEFMDNLSEGIPLFKVSCLALSKIEKKVGLKLILKFIEFVKKSEEEELSNSVYAILALLL